MGGKTWSFEEERFFWNDLIPQSPKGVVAVKRILDWEMCARRMQAAMGAQARRRYTKLMLFEHYFQNVSTGHMSPHALAFVNEHKRQLTAEADSANEDTQVLGSSTGNRGHDTGAQEKTTVATNAIQSPPVRNMPLARDHRQLPRLEIPSYLPQQTTALVTESSTDPNSYQSTPTTAFPDCWMLPPRFTLQGQASPHEYVSSPSYPTYGSGRAPLAQIVSPESSRLMSSYTSLPSTMPPFVNSESLLLPMPPVHSTKRKYEDSYLRGPGPNGPKRVAFSSPNLPLDTLAIAASMEHLAGGMGLPVDFPVHFSANLMPANPLGFSAVSSTTPSQDDEASPVDDPSADPGHAEHDNVLDVNGWSF